MAGAVAFLVDAVLWSPIVLTVFVWLLAIVANMLLRGAWSEES